jgi:hypothetical protein
VTEFDWLRYLATLPPELAELARHIMERCASVIAEEQLRHLNVEDRNHNDYNGLRMIVQDAVERVKLIERQVGDER